jgi:Polysaccharide biosynthesis protein.
LKDTNNNKSVIIRNSISGVVQKILTVILVFVSIPLFISHLGVDNYGLFAVVSVIGNLNMFANFGLNMALFVSLSGTTDKRKMSTNIIVSIFLMLVISATIALLLVAFKEPILNFILDASQKQIAEAKELFNYLLISNIFLFVGQSFTAILDSQQKIYLTNLLQFVYNLIYWLGLIIVVSFNGSLPEIGMMSLGASIVWFMSISIVSCKLFGKIYISKRLGDYIEDGKKQFKYGCKVYVSSLVGFMFEPLSKLLLSKFIGLGAVSLFEIALKVRSNLNELIIKALYPIQPYISRSEEKTHLYNTLKDLSLKIEYFCFQFAVSIDIHYPANIGLLVA